MCGSTYQTRKSYWWTQAVQAFELAEHVHDGLVHHEGEKNISYTVDRQTIGISLNVSTDHGHRGALGPRKLVRDQLPPLLASNPLTIYGLNLSLTLDITNPPQRNNSGRLPSDSFTFTTTYNLGT